ncbi:MAG: CBS domain-containing protein [Chloroflexi bacterium]|nr:CBS domain-containing protein [Chloroflexota bacterium]
MRHYLVREVMSQPAITIAWNASILDASTLMETHGVRRLPVIDDMGTVTGIVSSGDVREALSVYSTASPYAPDYDEILLAVGEIMSSPAYTVGLDDTLMHVVRLMVDQKIGSVPVVDAKEQPLGMITESDIFRLLIQTWETEDMTSSTP